MVNYTELAGLTALKNSNGLAIFFGAGISRDSGLPAANDLILAVLSSIGLNDKEIKYVLDEKNRRLAIPFESLMEIFSSFSDISKMFDLYRQGSPNYMHTCIARLAASRLPDSQKPVVRTIVTTNFDLLLERALEAEGLRSGVHFKVYCTESQFSEAPLAAEDNVVRIYKIHGSVRDRRAKSDAAGCTDESVRATLRAVASKTLSEQRYSVLRHLFSSGQHDSVIVLGYSGRDYFDLGPQILNLGQGSQKKNVVYVRHYSERSDEREGITENGNMDVSVAYDFRAFPGYRVVQNTGDFLLDLIRGNVGLPEKIPGKRPVVSWDGQVEPWAGSLGWKDQSGRITGKEEAIPQLKGRIFHKIARYDMALKYYNKALELFILDNVLYGQVTCLADIGSVFLDVKEYDKAEFYYRIAIELLNSEEKAGADIPAGNKGVLAQLYLNLGILFSKKHDLKTAFEYYQKSTEIYRQMNDEGGLTNCHLCQSADLVSLGDADRATRLLDEALKFFDRQGNVSAQAKCYGNLGNLYRGLFRSNEASGYYRESLRLHEKLGEIHEVQKDMMNLGTALDLSGDPQAALDLYNKSIDLLDAIGDRPGKASCYINMGISYRSLGRYDEALKYYDEAMKLKTESGDRLGIALCHCNIGDLYAAGDFDGHDLEIALSNYKQALAIFKEMGRQSDYQRVLNIIDTLNKLLDDSTNTKVQQPSSSLCKEYAKESPHNLFGSIDYRDVPEIPENILARIAEAGFRDFYTHFLRATHLLNQKRIGEAISEYHKAIMAKPDIFEAHYDLGVVLFNNGWLDEALEEFTNVTRLNPGFSMAYYNIGNVYLQKELLDKAVISYKEALWISPDLSEAHNNLGGIYLQKKMFEAAIAEFRLALDSDPTNEHARENLGRAYMYDYMDKTGGHL